MRWELYWREDLNEEGERGVGVLYLRLFLGFMKVEDE